jgi:hypothetical protein
VVKSKLDAGIYGPKRRRRYVLYAGAATSTLAVLVGLSSYFVRMSWF